MSLEAIKQVTEAEQKSQARKLEALAASKKTVADAERTGQNVLDEANSKAELQVKAMMKEAEEKANKQTEQLMADTKRDCQAMQQAAEGRVSKAVSLIVRRVVNT